MIHISNHPGYDLDNHDEFFDKYGRYLLLMMYMVKCGVFSAEREVPPLLNLMSAEVTNADQDHYDFDKNNIGRSVDDMITFLEDRIHIKDRDMDPTSQWELHPRDFTSLKSYLDPTEDRSVSGDLHQMYTQERQRVWVCTKHVRWYREATLQIMERFIDVDEGRCYYEDLNSITVRSGSEEMDKCFHDGMSKLRWIQEPDNKWSLTALYLSLHCDNSIATSTAHVVIDLNMIDYFELEINHLVMTVGVNQDRTRYLEMKIRSLDNLTSEEVEFIHGCHYTHLKMWRIQPEAHSQLVDILNSPKLEDLHIDCDMGQLTIIINLVLSTREKAIQDGDSLALRTLTVVEDGQYKSTITFIGDSQLFDMRSSISYLREEITQVDDPMFDFLRRYGWSIEKLTLSLYFNDQVAALLWDSIQERGSKMKTISVAPYYLTTSGLNILNQIIRILSRSTRVQLNFYKLDDERQLENTVHLLRLCKERVNHLELLCDSMKLWAPRLMQEFPDRTSFPLLESFGVSCNDYLYQAPEAYVSWIVTMISTPPEQTLPSTRLKWICLNWPLRHDDWRTVLDILDLSTLKELIVNRSNFSPQELELLVNRIVDSDASQVRLTTVRVDRELLRNDDAKILCSRLREKAPNVQVKK